jgi:DNA primase
VSRFYKDRIPHLKQTGAQWNCRCPRHGGKDPNFKVEAATGRWYCHSVCGRGGDIIDLEVALTGVDFKAAKTEVFRLVGRNEPRHTTGGCREVERYPYTDADDNLLLEVVRFLKPDGKKTFVRVRPSGVEAAGTIDPERIGGVPTGEIVIGLSKGKYLPDPKAERATTGKPTWKRASDQVDYDGAEYRFRDCPRVPYRLPKVLSAETVYLREGEKDVHTLEFWGLVASCNPGGSGESHLYTGWADYFRNRHVVILPDNDDPGRKHALAVATALLSAAASIRMVELPGLSEKGDVTDWRNSGGTLDQLREAVDAVALLDASSLAALRSRWSLADQEPKRQAARVEVTDDWPKLEPIQSELPPVQALSEALLPALFRPLVRDVTERMQVPMDYPATVTMLCLAGAVNRRAAIQPKANDTGWVVVPNLWGGIIAPPGFMKSPVIQAATRPLHQIQTEWRQAREEASEEYARGKEEYELRRAAWKEHRSTRQMPRREADRE